MADLPNVASAYSSYISYSIKTTGALKSSQTNILLHAVLDVCCPEAVTCNSVGSLCYFTTVGISCCTGNYSKHSNAYCYKDRMPVLITDTISNNL